MAASTALIQEAIAVFIPGEACSGPGHLQHLMVQVCERQVVLAAIEEQRYEEHRDAKANQLHIVFGLGAPEYTPV